MWARPDLPVLATVSRECERGVSSRGARGREPPARGPWAARVVERGGIGE